MPELGRTVGEELLEPTRIYVRPIKNILQPLPGQAARGARPGPHHRRRAGRQRAARPAAGPARVPQARQLAGAAGLRLAAAARATSTEAEMDRVFNRASAS